MQRKPKISLKNPRFPTNILNENEKRNSLVPRALGADPKSDDEVLGC
jgi:hypothetical protein